MVFTEKDMAEQARAIAYIEEEFSRLNARFDGLLKDARISEGDLRKLLEEKLPPDLEARLAKVKEEAERAGKARAAQARGPGKPAAPSGRGRPGAVRL
jgi:hypothetical protein